MVPPVAPPPVDAVRRAGAPATDVVDRHRAAAAPAGTPAPAADVAPSPELSLVLPVHNEAANLPELHRRITTALDGTIDYEVVFVDDGSRDDSAAIIAGLAEGDPRLRLVRLSRNFGHQAALAAGLDHARGAAVVLMDSDLQDPPELVVEMLRAWREGADVVYAVRRQRKEHALKRACYHLFYRLIRALSPVELPADSGDFSLLDRRVVDALVGLPEQKTYLRGLRSWVGFVQVPIVYERSARFAGRPTYGFRALRKLAMDGIVSSSSRPLRAASYIGFTVLAMAVAYLSLIIGWFFVRGTAPNGWTSLVGVVLFLGGVQLFLLGVLGEYVARIYDEVKRRPQYVVASKTGFGRGAGDGC
jgi:dolichol-phosphate mannosyltransferase